VIDAKRHVNKQTGREEYFVNIKRIRERETFSSQEFKSTKKTLTVSSCRSYSII